MGSEEAPQQLMMACQRLESLRYACSGAARASRSACISRSGPFPPRSRRPWLPTTQAENGTDSLLCSLSLSQAMLRWMPAVLLGTWPWPEPPHEGGSQGKVSALRRVSAKNAPTALSQSEDCEERVQLDFAAAVLELLRQRNQPTVSSHACTHITRPRSVLLAETDDSLH